jgi:signal transduction histidine kinase
MPTQGRQAGPGDAGQTPGRLLRDFFACGLLTVDGQGNLVFLTPQAERLLNRAGASGQGRSLVLPPPVLSTVREVLATGRPVTDRPIVCGQRTAADSSLLLTVVPAGPGAPAGGAAVLLKALASSAQLERHIQRLDRLANTGILSASLAHEIKNALVPVKTFVGLVMDNPPDADLAETVRHEISRIEAIVGRMLRPAAPAKPEFALVRLHELLEHSLRVIQHRTEGKTIAFHQQFDAHPDSLKGNDHLLEQAFSNLLLNAVEAVGPEGTIRVGTEIVSENERVPAAADPASRFLRVTINDTGAGIPAEVLDSIFEPFFTTKESGTGLGLAVTRSIIEDHRGTIGVESQPGKGTTFIVLLPCSGPGPR